MEAGQVSNKEASMREMRPEAHLSGLLCRLVCREEESVEMSEASLGTRHANRDGLRVDLHPHKQHGESLELATESKHHREEG